MTGYLSNHVARVLGQRIRATFLFASLALGGALTTSCDVHKASDPGTIASLTVSPNPSSMAINGTQQFVAKGTDFDGVDLGVSPTWSVVSGGGSISASGMFTAGTLIGTYASTVQAVSGGLTSKATVIVTVGPLATIVVSPTPMSLGIGATQQYTAIGKDAGGNVVAFTPNWAVIANGGVVNSTGMFTAGGTIGTFTNTIQASSGAITGTATVTVTAGPLATMTITPNPAVLNVGATQSFTATGKDAGGNAIVVTPVWSVVAGGGTIDPATGLFTAGAAGGTFANTVKATSGSITAFATVTVVPAGPARRSPRSPSRQIRRPFPLTRVNSSSLSDVTEAATSSR